MATAWSSTASYIEGDQVTDGGHTYEWTSADPSVGVEPPAGSWVRLDPASKPQVPATPAVQDVVDALVALGLITQAAS